MKVTWHQGAAASTTARLFYFRIWKKAYFFYFIGQYQPSIGMWECTKCPPGYYCLSTNDSKQIPCPERYYCPIGSSFPTLCPDGTYAETGDVKFENATQCRNCITGSYCRAGRIFGPCAAGYYCKSHSPDPNPLSNNSHPIEAYPCPAGYYCPNGTFKPLPCPENTLKNYVGGNGLLSDCKPCPVGEQCFNGMLLYHRRFYAIRFFLYTIVILACMSFSVWTRENSCSWFAGVQYMLQD